MYDTRRTKMYFHVVYGGGYIEVQEETVFWLWLFVVGFFVREISFELDCGLALMI